MNKYITVKNLALFTSLTTVLMEAHDASATGARFRKAALNSFKTAANHNIKTPYIPSSRSFSSMPSMSYTNPNLNTSYFNQNTFYPGALPFPTNAPINRTTTLQKGRKSSQINKAAKVDVNSIVKNLLKTPSNVSESPSNRSREFLANLAYFPSYDAVIPSPIKALSPRDAVLNGIKSGVELKAIPVKEVIPVSGRDQILSNIKAGVTLNKVPAPQEVPVNSTLAQSITPITPIASVERPNLPTELLKEIENRPVTLSNNLTPEVMTNEALIFNKNENLPDAKEEEKPLKKTVPALSFIAEASSPKAETPSEMIPEKESSSITAKIIKEAKGHHNLPGDDGECEELSILPLPIIPPTRTAGAEEAAPAEMAVPPPPVPPAPAIHNNAAETARNTIHVRIDDLKLPQTGNEVTLGVSAGKNSPSLFNSVWATGLYGVSKSNRLKDHKYRGVVLGPTVGADFNINESNIVGISYSNLVSKFNIKGLSRKKVEAESNIFSLYNLSQLNENWLLTNIALFSTTKLKTKRQSSYTSILETEATSKYSVKSQTFETILSYNNLSLM